MERKLSDIKRCGNCKIKKLRLRGKSKMCLMNQGFVRGREVQVKPCSDKWYQIETDSTKMIIGKEEAEEIIIF